LIKQRGFQIVTAYQNANIRLPERKTVSSAGYDIEAAASVTILPGKVELVPTGLKAHMELDEVLKLYARSSLALSRKLLIANGVGVVDQDYYNNPTNEGHILIPVYNFGTEPAIVAKGERVAQALFEKFLTSPTEIVPQGERSGGFGSTGK
jgi:dUTP pyrophosphatase